MTFAVNGLHVPPRFNPGVWGPLLGGEQSMFNQPPPPYTLLDTAQQPPAPQLEPEDIRQWRLRDERFNAMPARQFEFQCRFEEQRIIEQIKRRFVRRKETLPYVMGLEFNTNAENNVKNRWIEQGIWNDKWSRWARGGRWKHEESPGPEFEPAAEPGFEDRKAAHQHETRASRPYYQFMFQISKEREWLEDEPDGRLIDINAKAYENVKNRWLSQKIWNPKWDQTPGMTWMHEDPDHDDDDNNTKNPPSGESLPGNAVENNQQPPRRRRFRLRTQGFGFIEESSTSPEPTVGGGPSVAPRTLADSNGERTAANESMSSSSVPKRPDSTEMPQKPVNRALRANGTSKVRKQAKRKPPTRQLRKRLCATSGLSDAPQSIAANATESLPAEDHDEPCLAASVSTQLNLDAVPGKHEQKLRRSSRISARSRTNGSSVPDNASVVGASKIPQLRSTRANRRTSTETSANSRKPQGVMKRRSKRP
ncbi:hypothetical protein AJ78_04192 [Emergomyces pasteurianus Ep9510]|uniref:Uncharacterized protein n=1 Tax=Emergomyces pasteurianus Ep9510 TaxID=1447872 RepID=A0A1J9PGL7_9EURO|nr:hypothetical protein AJ78_04192 [Emergomyces pasteurianus Ep9510]